MTICTLLRIQEVRVYGLRRGTAGDGSEHGLPGGGFFGADEATR
jgi:hypothetical protein